MDPDYYTSYVSRPPPPCPLPVIAVYCDSTSVDNKNRRLTLWLSECLLDFICKPDAFRPALWCHVFFMSLMQSAQHTSILLCQMIQFNFIYIAPSLNSTVASKNQTQGWVWVGWGILKRQGMGQLNILLIVIVRRRIVIPSGVKVIYW